MTERELARAAAHRLAIILKGTETSDRQCIQRVRRIGSPFPREVRSMLFAVFYLLLRRLVGLASGCLARWTVWIPVGLQNPDTNHAALRSYS